MVNEREKLIGARLRAFRETLQIPRSRFAVTIRFGSDRLASYEAGRAPLLYEVAKSVMTHYHISPLWLATGEGAPRLPIAFDDNHIMAFVKPRALFSEIYDAHLAADLENKKAGVGKVLNQYEHWLNECLAILDDESIPASVRKPLAARMEPILLKVGQKLKWDFPFVIALEEKKHLTKYPLTGKYDDVKPILPKLIERLRKATKERGRKTELASWLGVAPQKVTDWLSERVEPSGEITLRLLHWVEQQERQN